MEGTADGEWRPYVTLDGPTGTVDWDHVQLGAAGFQNSVMIVGGGPTDFIPPTLTNLMLLTPLVPAGGQFNGTFTCTGPAGFPPPPDTYTVVRVLVGDRAGNWNPYEASQLGAMGFGGLVFVVN